MAKPEPFVGPGADPLKLYLRGERVAISGIEDDLRDASANAQRRINKLESKHGIGAVVRRTQLAVIRRELRSVTNDLWRNVGKRIRSAGNAVADAAAEAEAVLERILFRSVGARESEALLVAQRAYARRTVANYLARGQNGIGLSQRVYRTSQLANGFVDRAVNRVILQGGSWQEVASAVKPMIDPSTPGGVSYAAKRLGRTELNNAFHTTQQKSAEVNPFVLGVRWHLSLSHTKKDQCDVLATGHSDGKPSGVYVPSELPRKAHPQCLCFTTNEMMDEEDFLDLVSDPDYLDGLVDEYGQEIVTLKKAVGAENVSPAKPKAPSPRTPQPRPRPRTGQQALDAAPKDINDSALKVNGTPGIDSDRDQIQQYRGVLYSNVNKYLREGAGSFYKEQVAAIDRSVGKSKLKSDVIVWRGIKDPRGIFGDRIDGDLNGLEWIDDAYLSTSADPRIATGFAERTNSSDGGMVINILVRKGAPMLRLSNFAPAGHKIDSTSPEAELLGGRGWRLRVIADHGQDSKGLRNVDVEVISHVRQSTNPWQR